LKSFALRTSRKEEMLDITESVQRIVDESGVEDGLCCVFVPHTTAAVTINENADPSVKEDILSAATRLVPENWDYKHLEGNAHAHIKASLFGSSVLIPVVRRRLFLGTWQGIFFCEFDGPRSRTVSVKVLKG